MNKSISSFAALFLLAIPSALFAAERSQDYPLRVSILGKHGRSNSNTMCPYSVGADAWGSGYGNLLQGDEPRGFRFAYTCSSKLPKTNRNVTYAARWKKPELQLTLLIPVEGKKDKFWTCDLDIRLKKFVFDKENTTLSVPEMKRRMHKQTEAANSVSQTSEIPGDKQ